MHYGPRCIQPVDYFNSSVYSVCLRFPLYLCVVRIHLHSPRKGMWPVERGFKLKQQVSDGPCEMLDATTLRGLSVVAWSFCKEDEEKEKYPWFINMETEAQKHGSACPILGS